MQYYLLKLILKRDILIFDLTRSYVETGIDFYLAQQLGAILDLTCCH